MKPLVIRLSRTGHLSNRSIHRLRLRLLPMLQQLTSCQQLNRTKQTGPLLTHTERFDSDGSNTQNEIFAAGFSSNRNAGRRRPSLFAWFTLYEGSVSEVGLDNLKPGSLIWFRVRAAHQRSSSISSEVAPGVIGSIPPSPSTASPSNILRLHEANDELRWGRASKTPLEVHLPATTPGPPTAAPRLVGNPEPVQLQISWQPPCDDGGAPIVAYEASG
ncbi:unnamed protein product [Protopolystoma xenopodis]|uniref:Fibronectin type-III domain-containing protein n=1 Tax=Protopolystoma xenopodis TaxID=117903 RepID=A0A3S5BEV2_9PLAT|nr:unnamed protein product [Protopolystoma xenopodis]